MNTKLLIKISLQNLKKHKGRSFLTILGIIVGIASIISTLAIGYGAEEKIKRKILGMGKNYIFIHPSGISEGKTKFKIRKIARPIVMQDVEIFKRQCSQIKKITPTMFCREIIRTKKNNVLVDIKCGNEHYLDVIKRKIKKGNFFSQYHLKKNSKVVVLGNTTTKELFGKLNPIGKTIAIRNITFKVIGTVKKIKNYFGESDPNLDIYMPITTAKKQIFKNCNQSIHGIAISAKKKNHIPEITKKLKTILRFKHRLKNDEPNDFTICDQQAMINAAKNSSNVLNLLLFIIAAISLIVGGIGVMNIMLVSVFERTKEIGIRMALGATKSIILKQFILESITLCFIGGIIGIFLGIITPHIVSIFTGWIVVLKTFTIFLAFFVTFIIGIIFGYYPSLKASKLKPIDALIERG